MAYFNSRFAADPEVDEDDVDADELVEFSSQQLNTDPSHEFIFKGMENIYGKVSQIRDLTIQQLT
jgi:hypothetical protein